MYTTANVCHQSFVTIASTHVLLSVVRLMISHSIVMVKLAT